MSDRRRCLLVAAILAAATLPSLNAQGMGGASVAAAPRAEASGQPFDASFLDVAAESGLHEATVFGDPRRKNYIIEAIGAGVAFVDYDRDGRLDIFLLNGSRLRGFEPGSEPTNRLYRNTGQGRFQDVSVAAGVAKAGWHFGVCGGDYDNDGFLDLYVTAWGSNSLYRNTAEGRYVERAAEAGVLGPDSEWTTGCSFLDYDRDGLLDLFTVSYVDFDPETTPEPGAAEYCRWKGEPVYCGPRGLGFGTARLYRNLGDGRFEDRSAVSGVAAAKGFYGFTVLAEDFDQDGWTDVYVASDSTRSLYFRNEGDGTFSEIGVQAGVAYSEHGGELAGMGAAAADIDHDGDLDLLKTNFIWEYPNLYVNAGDGFFEDLALGAGLGVNPQHVLWGVGAVDLDNDGSLDLVQTTGHVFSSIARIAPEESYRGPTLVYRNLGSGRFEDVTALAGPGAAAEHPSRGAAFGDYDNDGDMDVVVVNMGEAPSLLRNDLRGAERGWVKIALEGVASNRSAVGARVTLHAGEHRQTATISSQSSFLSLNDHRLHFGLGDADSIDRVEVRWPNGNRETFAGVRPGGLWVLVEGAGQAKRAELPK